LRLIKDEGSVECGSVYQRAEWIRKSNENLLNTHNAVDLITMTVNTKYSYS